MVKKEFWEFSTAVTSHVFRIRAKPQPSLFLVKLHTSEKPVIAEAVEFGPVIRTDGWKGYNNLSQRDYVHEIACKQAIVKESLLPPATNSIPCRNNSYWALDNRQTFMNRIRPNFLPLYCLGDRIE